MDPRTEVIELLDEMKRLITIAGRAAYDHPDHKAAQDELMEIIIFQLIPALVHYIDRDRKRETE